MVYKAFTDKISKTYPDVNAIFKESEKRTVTVTFCNPLNVKILRNNKRYERYINSIDFIYADGMLLCKLVETVTGQKCIRVSFDGNSVAPEVFELCKKYNRRVALVGTTNDYISTAVDKLKSQINIVYYRNGFFSDDDEINDFFEELKSHKVDFILFGMGAPHQEKMLYLLKQKDLKILAFTCGGYLDQIAQRGLIYYPEFYNKYNLRWLYRILNEPSKLLRRYFIDYSPFYGEYAKVFWHKMFGNKV